MSPMRSLFGGNGGPGFSGPFGNMMNTLTKFREFMQNPVGAFMGTGLNIPPNIQNNPEAITNYLRSSGQMTDDQYNQAVQFANMAQNFIGKKS